MNKINYLIIHHSGNASKSPQLWPTNLYHKSKDFPKSSLGYYIGYSYFLEKDGRVIQTRLDDEEQAHTKGMNKDSIGICLAGNFDVERPSFEQTVALKNLINQKMREYTILPGNIAGHRMFRETSCPGDKITEQEMKNLFVPDISYYQKLLNTLKELLDKLLKRTMPLGYEKDDTCEKVEL